MVGRWWWQPVVVVVVSTTWSSSGTDSLPRGPPSVCLGGLFSGLLMVAPCSKWAVVSGAAGGRRVRSGSVKVRDAGVSGFQALSAS